MDVLRILIADDHAMVRNGLRNLILKHAGWQVCGEAGDGSAALALALEQQPDIAIVDVSLPIINGLALTRRLREDCPKVKTLLFTMIEDEETVMSGIAAGARGYLLKSDNSEHLEAAISALADNRPYFSAPVSHMLQTATPERRRTWLDAFTARELEVAHLIAEGNCNKSIARILGISPKTVEAHRAAAMRKAGVRSAAELVRFAIRRRLIQA
jgi:DNA-binding NarL/FixJ family response regulator